MQTAHAQKTNLLAFPSQQTFQRIEQFQTPAERLVYSKMYVETKNGMESKRFTLDRLMLLTGYKSQNTVRAALAGLVRKKHVTVLDRKGCRHHGILYRVQFPHEIRTMNQDSDYVLEQVLLAEEAKKPKPKQPKLPLDFAAPAAPEEPEIEVTREAIEVTAETETSEPENARIEVTEPQKLRSQNLLILFMVLKHVLDMNNHGGEIPNNARAHMREAEQPSAHTANEGEVIRLLPCPDVQPVCKSARKSEGDKADGMPRATATPETTELGKALMVMLGYTDLVLDDYLRGTLRRGCAWFTANKATPAEILRYKVWWWESGRTRPPKLDWMIENFPVFRGEIVPPEATGAAARKTKEPANTHLKARYEFLAKQMSHTYAGKHWESLSEQISTFKRYVCNADLPWNDDLVNEIFGACL